MNILPEGENSSDSPSKDGASEPVDVSKDKCKVPGVEKAVLASFPTEFIIDATKTGKATLEVEVVVPNGEELSCEGKDKGDETFDCSDVPEKKGMS